MIAIRKQLRRLNDWVLYGPSKRRHTILRSVDGAATHKTLVNPSGPFNTKTARDQAAEEARKRG